MFNKVQANLCAATIIDDLCGRNGLMEEWDNLDEDIQAEIILEIRDRILDQDPGDEEYGLTGL